MGSNRGEKIQMRREKKHRNPRKQAAIYFSCIKTKDNEYL
jgi:hypothetical protein